MPRIMMMTARAGEGTAASEVKIPGNPTNIHRAGGRRLARVRVAGGPRRTRHQGLDPRRLIINRQKKEANKGPARQAPAPKLVTKQTRDGVEKVTASGQVREKTIKKSDGEHTQYVAPTGRVQREVVRKSDGTEQATHYAPSGKVDR